MYKSIKDQAGCLILGATLLAGVLMPVIAFPQGQTGQTPTNNTPSSAAPVANVKNRRLTLAEKARIQDYIDELAAGSLEEQKAARDLQQALDSGNITVNESFAGGDILARTFPGQIELSPDLFTKQPLWMGRIIFVSTLFHEAIHYNQWNHYNIYKGLYRTSDERLRQMEIGAYEHEIDRLKRLADTYTGRAREILLAYIKTVEKILQEYKDNKR